MEDKNVLKADVLEIFSSLQGEGPFMGVRQIFVKFAGCNMSCGFCDAGSTFPPKNFSIDKLVSIVRQIRENAGDHHSISLTGGEPLLYAEYLKKLLPKIKEMRLKIYLETNATLPEALSGLVDYIDIIAADFKLPSSTGCRDYWGEHERFLTLARGRNCFVKIVITSKTNEKDIKKTVDIIRRVDKDTLLILQPVWPTKSIERPKNKRLLNYLFLAEDYLRNVRIMPQMHKFLGVR